MRQGGDPRLPLELALVRVTRPQADLSRESLVFRLEQLEHRMLHGGAPATAAPAAMAPAPAVAAAPSQAPPASTSPPAVPAPSPPAAAPAPAAPAAPAPVPTAAAPAAAPAAPPVPAPAQPAAPAAPAAAPAGLPPLSLDQLRDAWERSVLPAVGERSIPTASILREARPAKLDGEELTLEFPPSASFHRKLAEDEKNASILRDALREVTGRALRVLYLQGTVAAPAQGGSHDGAPAGGHLPVTEDDIISMLKDTLDAREVEDQQ
jgi:hypothetical protein